MNYPYNYNYNFPTPSSSSMVGNCGGGAKEKKKGSGKKNTNGAKTAPSVRLSTDPQSVAARERRHRISDRFKILQSMVPGGTKMDTVSMLDEAIHYVKFLKTQIWLHETMINLVDDDHVPAAADAGLHLTSGGNSDTLQEMSGYAATEYQDLVSVVQPAPPLFPGFQDFGFQCDEIMQYNGYMKN